MSNGSPVSGRFYPFLPHDNTESSETEDLVAAIAAELAKLLGAKPADFWRVVRDDVSLLTCISSYLQFCRRAYDEVPQTATAVSLARRQLARNMFLTLFRMVTIEPDGCISCTEQAELLYNQQILDLPKLLDVAALYGQSNPDLTRHFFHQAFDLQPQYATDLANLVPTVLSNITDVQQTCTDALRRLQENPTGPTLAGILDGLTYLRDTCATLAELTNGYPPAAMLLLQNGGLASLLATLHDHLLPSALTAWSTVRNHAEFRTEALKMQRLLVWLGDDLQRLLFMLLERAFLEPYGISAAAAASPSRRRADPEAKERGRAFLSLLQAVKTSTLSSGNGLLQLTSKRFKLEQKISIATQQGHIALDTMQKGYLFALLGSTQNRAAAWTAEQASSSAAKSAEREVQLKQIHEVLPGYGDGFLAACLDAAGQDSEQVIHQLLEGSLPAELAKLDPKMALQSSQLLETKSQAGAAKLTSVELNRRQVASQARLHGGLDAAASSAAVHKGTLHALQSTSQDRALAKLHAQATQWEEYEDEYDDSFDDLAGYDADTNADTQGDKVDALPGAFAPMTRQQQSSGQLHVQPKGAKPLWVLNGRVFNYRKEGATPVANQAAADEAVRAAQSAQQAIHSLGAGGNRPPPQRYVEGQAQAADGFGSERGGPPGQGREGRGRGRGFGNPSEPNSTAAKRAHAFKDSHKAAISNHHRKDRALRKTGGPLG